MTNAVALKRVPLPATYAEAKHALALCVKIDECKDWADKAKALASYAKQANDKSLEETARRIRARAIQRQGQLLREIEPDPGGRPSKTSAGTHEGFRKQAAEAAGISERQAEDAVAVANVPEREFKAAVENDNPASVTKLAKMGRKKRPVKVVTDHLRGRSAADYNRVFHFIALFERTAKEINTQEPLAVVPHLLDDEREELWGYLSRIERAVADVREAMSG